MSSSGQRLANGYPLWTKIRSDPSSLGNRVFSVFGSYFDFTYAEMLKVKDEPRLLKEGLGVGQLYVVNFTEGEGDQLTLSTGGLSIVGYPELVVGTTMDGIEIDLSRDADVEDLLYGTPTRLTEGEVYDVSYWGIWDSEDNAVYNPIASPEKLTILTSGSTEFYTLDRNPGFSGSRFVQLKGIDPNDQPFIETIPVKDDGLLRTRNIFKELTEVSSDGFDGRIRVYIGNSSSSYVVDPFRSCVMPELEGPSWLRLVDDCLEYFTPIFKLGVEYRHGANAIEENEEILTTQKLLDADSVAYTPVGLAVSLESTRLYVIDSAGILHIYEPKPASFGIPQNDIQTAEAHVIVLPLTHYAQYDSTLPLWTWFRQPRFPVVSVTVKRIDPDGTVEYLQANKTWGASLYAFPGEAGAPGTVLPEATWQDIKFYSTYDTIGQWDYYCICNVVNTEQSTYISHTAVMCDFIESLVDLDTEVVSPTGIFFSESGELCITTASQCHRFTEHRDTYTMDSDGDRLFVKEEFASIEVT